jgi:hypothetical protein
MAWGFISDLPISSAEYDALDAEIAVDPPGLVLHTASRSEIGIRIIDVWKSEEAFRRFEAEELMPAMGRLGWPPPPDGAPGPVEFEIHKMRPGS